MKGKDGSKIEKEDTSAHRHSANPKGNSRTKTAKWQNSTLGRIEQALAVRICSVIGWRPLQEECDL
jgi:hypothetical protein